MSSERATVVVHFRIVDRRDDPRYCAHLECLIRSAARGAVVRVSVTAALLLPRERVAGAPAWLTAVVEFADAASAAANREFLPRDVIDRCTDGWACVIEADGGGGNGWVVAAERRSVHTRKERSDEP